ncbi:WD-40 repeat-containing protein MSI4 [Vitis vinifera]|uniref:WD-40 repeat-containing protein MSI4 n=1 Tax=Vitis vinifera TaxID=29760 RepID=A0A438K6N3_VITVI|nr:WD-40 repeat-containing protein MSI4 [Vitis vinifera]
MKETSTAGETSISVDERYTQWKSLVPVLYDWLANHNLVWPSLSCRVGVEKEGNGWERFDLVLCRTDSMSKNLKEMVLILTDGSVPNTLVIANCEVVKPRVAAAEHIAQFNEEARSPFVKKFKTIIHPGEVNRIRELPQNSKIVATHTDSPDVLIWDVETQPNRHAVLGTPESRPDLFWFTFSLAVNLHDVWSPPNKSGERFSGTFEPRITGSAYLETTEGKVLFLGRILLIVPPLSSCLLWMERMPPLGQNKTSGAAFCYMKLQTFSLENKTFPFDPMIGWSKHINSEISSVHGFKSKHLSTINSTSHLVFFKNKLLRHGAQAVKGWGWFRGGYRVRWSGLLTNLKFVRFLWVQSLVKDAIYVKQHFILQILTGHKDNAEFALAMCPTEPLVLSGGKDKSVVLWSIQDHISTLAADPGSAKSTSKAGGGNDKPVESPSIGARGIYQGHDDTVEDVQFCPLSAQEFCSVGDDSCLILWDARSGTTPAIKVEKAHNADLHCVDWNPHDINLILTGSADNTVRMFDRRKLTSGGIGSPIHTFEGHTAAVLCVQWSPDKASIFGSSAEDGILNLWNHEKIDKKQAPNAPPGYSSDMLAIGIRSWTSIGMHPIHGQSLAYLMMVKVLVEVIWRMIDLIYRNEDEVLAELDNFKAHLATCSP